MLYQHVLFSITLIKLMATHLLLFLANQIQEKEHIQRGIFSITYTYFRHLLKTSIPTKLFLFLEQKRKLDIDSIGIAPLTQLRTCVIKIVTFKGGHLMW